MNVVRVGILCVVLGIGVAAAQAPQPGQGPRGPRAGQRGQGQGQGQRGPGQRAKHKARQAFQRIDTNQDGKIDAAEAQAAGKPDIMNADADQDGFVTPQELAQAARQRIGKQLFDRLDANQDGVLDASELQGKAQRLLQADANGDGQVTPDELKAFVQAQRPQGPGQGGPGGGARQAFQAADANQDGKLDASEWPATAAAAFADVDANNDGFVDRDEVRAYAQANQASPL